MRGDIPGQLELFLFGHISEPVAYRVFPLMPSIDTCRTHLWSCYRKKYLCQDIYSRKSSGLHICLYGGMEHHDHPILFDLLENC